MSKLTEILRNFGLSEYEARALLALLSKGTMTAKEVAEISGIPRTSVYDVMNSLLTKGLIESFGKPMKFKALKADEIISMISRKVTENLRFLKEELPKVEAQEVDIISVYRGDFAIEKLKEMVENAVNEILVVMSYIPSSVAKILKRARCRLKVVASNAEDLPANENYVLDRKELLEGMKDYSHGFVIFDQKKAMLLFTNSTKIAIVSDSKAILEFLQMLVEPLINMLRNG